MFGTIYKIRNLINGKLYVGQTTSRLSERWSQHKCDAIRRNRNTYICNAIRKYGAENFEITALATCDSLEEMNNREIYYIKLLRTVEPHGYNLSPGGLSWERTQETRNKLASYRRGRKLSEETKRKISENLRGPKNHNYGKKMPQHVKDKISEANKGNSHPHKQETKDKISEANGRREWKLESRQKLSIQMTGKKRVPHSETTKQKMSNARKGFRQTDDTKKKLSRIKTGTTHSSETKIKIGELSKARFSDEKERLRMSKLNGDRKTKVLCVTNGVTYDGIGDAARTLDVSTSDICHVLSKKRKHAKGYVFERV